MKRRARAGVYQLMNTVTGKVYVGSAVNIRRRKIQHLHALNRGTHKNKKLQGAFNKYGAAAFVFEDIETCAKPLLISREQFWIDTLDAVSAGYNLNPTAGSALGRRFPGKRLSPETSKKIGDALRGRVRTFTPEWREHLSEAARRPRPCLILPPVRGATRSPAPPLFSLRVNPEFGTAGFA